MVNAKVKVLGAQYYSDLEDEVNSFLATIYYIGIGDIRDIKIDNILKNPL